MTLVICAATAIACGTPGSSVTTEDRRTQHRPLVEGIEASSLTAVFSLQTRYASTSRRCTAFLIAPNLFVTARHCLAASETTLTCDTPFPGLVEPSSLDFTNPTRVDSVEAETTPIHHGALIHVPAGGSLCGDDLALVVTEESIDDVPPIALRLDDPPVSGDSYAAVGYGLLGELIGGEGTRRARSDLLFGCSTVGCAPTLVNGEILGENAPCEGDSGGPALDSKGRALAVLSRGTASCETPIYETLFAHREWLREASIEAAITGNYDPPAWVTPPQPIGLGGGAQGEAGAGGEGGEGGTPMLPHGMAGGPAAQAAPPEEPGCSCSWIGRAPGAGGLATMLGALFLAALIMAALPLRRLRRKPSNPESTRS